MNRSNHLSEISEEDRVYEQKIQLLSVESLYLNKLYKVEQPDLLVPELAENYIEYIGELFNLAQIT